MTRVTIFQPDGTQKTHEEGNEACTRILDRSDDYPVVRVFTENGIIVYKGIPFVIETDRDQDGRDRR